MLENRLATLLGQLTVLPRHPVWWAVGSPKNPTPTLGPAGLELSTCPCSSVVKSLGRHVQRDIRSGRGSIRASAY